MFTSGLSPANEDKYARVLSSRDLSTVHAGKCIPRGKPSQVITLTKGPVCGCLIISVSPGRGEGRRQAGSFHPPPKNDSHLGVTRFIPQNERRFVFSRAIHRDESMRATCSTWLVERWMRFCCWHLLARFLRSRNVYSPDTLATSRPCVRVSAKRSLA